MLLAIIIGTILYIKTFSKWVVKINMYIINFIKNIFIHIAKLLIFPLKIIKNFLEKTVFKPIYFIILNFNKNLKNKYQKNIPVDRNIIKNKSKKFIIKNIKKIGNIFNITKNYSKRQNKIN